MPSACAIFVVKWPLRIYHIIPRCLINAKIWGKKLNVKCLFLFSPEICRKNWEIYYIKYTELHVNYPLFLSYFKQIEPYRKIFERYSNIKFHENPYSGGRVVPCWQRDGRTDRQTDRCYRASSRSLQFSRAPETLHCSAQIFIKFCALNL
jgi:hypothetical protein